MNFILKKEKMIAYLEGIKAKGETFTCMLWGIVHANISSFHDRSAMSWISAFTFGEGVWGSLDKACCYIGLTEKRLYVVALDNYNYSRITGNFKLPLADITSLNVRDALIGRSRIVEVECGERIELTVKRTWFGTNIKDQKVRMAEFLEAIDALQISIWRKRRNAPNV